MTGSTRSYNNGTKNHWRRTIWNEVLRRTNGRHKRDPILYLLGPEDLDRKIAIAKGVPEHNLIGIDRREANVLASRAKRGTSIQGDALQVLANWPASRPVAAVLLDFCSGIEKGNASAFSLFDRPALRDAVIVLNFMRGRDPWSNSLRNELRDNGLYVPLADLTDGRALLDADPQNRAYQYLLLHAWRNAQLAGLLTPESLADFGFPGHRVIANVLASMHPRFYSYNSGALVFDTAVAFHPLRAVAELGRRNGKNIAEMDAKFDRSLERDPAMVRRIAATLAVRTMRARA